MKKKICGLILGLLTCFILASCATKIDNNHKTLIDLITYFDNNGLKADKIYPALSDMIKADSGAVLMLEGQVFEVYKYNLNNPIQKARYDKIKESNHVLILGFNHRVVLNGSFMLLNYQGHPKEAQIVETFEKFK